MHALMNVADERDLLNRPWVGASWEGFVIEQVLGVLEQRETQFEAFFLRTADQHEIDLVLDFGGTRCAVEVKLTSSPGPEDMARLNRIADLIKADRRILVSQIRSATRTEVGVSCNLPWLLEHVDSITG